MSKRGKHEAGKRRAAKAAKREAERRRKATERRRLDHLEFLRYHRPEPSHRR